MLPNMHNHNLGTHSEEDINMPNGFDNPYITGGAGDPYTGEIDFSQWASDIGDWPSVQFQLPGLYQYQGMSPEIMSALGNIFGGAEGGFMDLLPGAWENWGTEDEFLNMMSQEYSYGDEGLTMDWSLGEDAPLGAITGTENLGQGFFANFFDPESLAATLSQIAGFGTDPDISEIRPGEVKALTPEMIEKTTSAYYSPYEEVERGTLVDKLSKAMGKAGTGGFAGSGGRESGLSGAEKLYRGGYEDILADIMKLRGGATENVLDTIYGWQELLSGQ